MNSNFYKEEGESQFCFHIFKDSEPDSRDYTGSMTEIVYRAMIEFCLPSKGIAMILQPVKEA